MYSETPNSKYHVTNLERALNILERLSENPQGLTNSDIAKELSISRNSVYRITSTLVNYGYLVRDKQRRTFSLSLKLLTIGIRSHSDPSVVEQALPVMHKLQKKYRETIPLGVRRDKVGVVLEAVEGTYPFRYVLEAGKLFHLHTSAPGKSIMAYLPEAERNELIENIEYKVFNERTIRTPEQLRGVLETVRSNGYAVDHAEETEGMHCVGAPIFNRKGYPVASIWITGPSTRMQEEDFPTIGCVVRSHADMISKNLGYNTQSD